MWRSEESWGRLAAVYMAAGLAAGLFIAVLEGYALPEAPRPMLPVILGVAVVVGGLVLRRAFSGRLTGRFVALNADGVVIGTRPTPRFVPWHDFDGVVTERGITKVRSRSSPVPIALEDVFNNAEEAAEFRAAAAAAARAHRRGTQPPGTMA